MNLTKKGIPGNYSRSRSVFGSNFSYSKRSTSTQCHFLSRGLEQGRSKTKLPLVRPNYNFRATFQTNLICPRGKNFEKETKTKQKTSTRALNRLTVSVRHLLSYLPKRFPPHRLGDGPSMALCWGICFNIDGSTE